MGDNRREDPRPQPYAILLGGFQLVQIVRQEELGLVGGRWVLRFLLGVQPQRSTQFVVAATAFVRAGRGGGVTANFSREQ